MNLNQRLKSRHQISSNKLTSGGNAEVNVLKFDKVSPKINRRPWSSSTLSPLDSIELGALNNTLKMACVAQALVVTCLAKNKSAGESSSLNGLFPVTAPSEGLLDDCHLNRKIKPWTLARVPSRGLVRSFKESLSSDQSSVNSAFLTPKLSMREVKTPGSDSIVNHSEDDMAIDVLFYRDRQLYQQSAKKIEPKYH